MAGSASDAGAATLRIDSQRTQYPLAHAFEFLEDAEGRLTIDDVRAQRSRFEAATPRAGDVNFGYSKSAYWLALPVETSPDAPARWLLEIGYASLDRVEVYSPRGDVYERQVAGDLQPYSERPYPHRHLVFPLELEPGTTQTVYLRVASAGNLTIPAVLWEPRALHVHDQKSYAVLSLYYGMLLVLFLYNLLLYVSVRDSVFLYYVLFVASMAMAMISLNGFGNQFVWPEYPRWGNVALPAGMCTVGFFAALFTRRFLDTRERFPRADRAILAFAAAFALCALSLAVIPYRIAGIATTLLGLTFSMVAVGVGLHCHLRGHPGARYFLVAWSLLLAGVAGLALRNLDIVPTITLTAYSMQIGSALEMLLLSFALADRIRTQRELLHLAHHDALTGLANRMLLADRIEHAIARARRAQSRVAVLVTDLDGFKEVNDTHGHAAGDRVLQAIAARLRALVRQSDTVARLGGDEFVVALENIAGCDAAANIARKIVIEAGKSIELDSAAEARVSASVGVACFPDHADNVDALLKRADEAMYEAKSSGRNAWRMARG